MECVLRDVWVSWFESEFYGFNVSEFHEWRKDDYIELVDTIPITLSWNFTVKYTSPVHVKSGE